MSDLVYVYAILAWPQDMAVDGIDGRPLRWIVHDGLAAAVSNVPDDDFEEQPLNDRVRDLSWLGPRAVIHQDVNERLWDQCGASVPLAFGTVFRDDDRVRQLLHDQADSVRRRLQAVAGCGEWVVALHRVAAPSTTQLEQSSTELQRLHADIAASSPGRAHLLRRQMATLERDEARRLDAQAADGLAHELRAVARDVFQEPLPADAVERPLVRLSILVAREDENRLLDGVESVRQRWPEPAYRLLLTGPWPPYRFGGLGAS